jgi:hypothetical protein
VPPIRHNQSSDSLSSATSHHKGDISPASSTSSSINIPGAKNLVSMSEGVHSKI